MIDSIKQLLQQEAQAVLNIPVTDAYEKAVKLIVEQIHQKKGKLVTSGMGKDVYKRQVQEEYGTNTSMLYMPIIHLWKEEDIKATESFIKDFTPIAYELCFKDEQTSNLKVIDKIVQSGSRVWMNTLWDSLCGGHDDENALLEGKDKHWGWILEHKATMIQTDRPQELIKYLEDKGLRKL